MEDTCKPMSTESIMKIDIVVLSNYHQNGILKKGWHWNSILIQFH